MFKIARRLVVPILAATVVMVPGAVSPTQAPAVRADSTEVTYGPFPTQAAAQDYYNKQLAPYWPVYDVKQATDLQWYIEVDTRFRKT